MNKPLHDIELIERYFDPEISESEKEILLGEIEKDAHLKAAFEQEKLLISTIRFEAATKDLQFLKQVEKKLSGSESGGWPIQYYAIAASLAIFIIAGIFLLPFGKTSTEDLYAENFVPYPNSFEPVVRGNEMTTARSQAFAAYENGDYKKAAELFMPLLKENHEPGILLLAANAQLAMGNTDQATPLLKELIQSGSELDVEAKWYLALSYLKAGQKEAAKKILSDLGATEMSYAKKAKSLLQKMD